MRSSAYAIVAAVAIALPGVAAGQGFQYASPWTVGNYYSAGGYAPGVPAGAMYAPQGSYNPGGAYAGYPSVASGASVEASYQPPADYSLGAPAAPCHGADCGHCCASQCSTGCCLHRTGLFADYLYWQVSDADLPFVVPQDGIGAIGTVPIGEATVLDPDHESAFRVGGNFALDCTSSMTFVYTKFETNTQAELIVPPPFVVQPLVTLPSTFNAGSTGQLAVSEWSLEFETFDLEYRAVLLSCSKYYINGVIGGRYVMYDQDFTSAFFFAPPDGTTFVNTAIDFDGAGIRSGVEGEHRLCLGLYGYGKLIGSLIAGEFRSAYQQFNQFNGEEGTTRMRESRVVPMIETELGLGWCSANGRVRFSAGYYFSIWSNMITAQEWINAVQTTSFESPSRDAKDDIRIDGLVTRLELRL